MSAHGVVIFLEKERRNRAKLLWPECTRTAFNYISGHWGWDEAGITWLDPADMVRLSRIRWGSQ